MHDQCKQNIFDRKIIKQLNFKIFVHFISENDTE